VFVEDVFTRLGFIRRAQSLGFTLTEIKEFLDMHDQGDLPCSRIQVKLQDNLTEIEEKIQQLQLLKQELSGLLTGWQSTLTVTDKAICPIIGS
jgi:DNA-binding transcriptional MerR regulator